MLVGNSQHYNQSLFFYHHCCIKVAREIAASGSPLNKQGHNCNLQPWASSVRFMYTGCGVKRRKKERKKSNAAWSKIHLMRQMEKHHRCRSSWCISIRAGQKSRGFGGKVATKLNMESRGTIYKAVISSGVCFTAVDYCSTCSPQAASPCAEQVVMK